MGRAILLWALVAKRSFQESYGNALILEKFEQNAHSADIRSHQNPKSVLHVLLDFSSLCTDFRSFGDQTRDLCAHLVICY
ncbi:MAG TPA: hypothetical protein VJ928_02510 [Marivita sp.]|nr:hypothetical protein [Marivita sp.]